MQTEFSFVDNGYLVGKIYKLLYEDVYFFYKPDENKLNEKKHTARNKKEIDVVETRASINYNYSGYKINTPHAIITNYGIKIGKKNYQFLKTQEFEKKYIPIITEKMIGKLYDLPNNYKILSMYLLHYGWYHYIKNKIISFPDDKNFEKMGDIFENNEDLLKKFIISNINPESRRKKTNYTLVSKLREAKEYVKLPKSKITIEDIITLDNKLKKELKYIINHDIEILEDELKILIEILKEYGRKLDNEDSVTIKKMIKKYRNTNI
jgi:hypothetical protein